MRVGLFERIKLGLLAASGITVNSSELWSYDFNEDILGAKIKKRNGNIYLIVDFNIADVRSCEANAYEAMLALRNEDVVMSYTYAQGSPSSSILTNLSRSTSVRLRFNNNKLIINIATSDSGILTSGLGAVHANNYRFLISTIGSKAEVLVMKDEAFQRLSIVKLIPGNVSSFYNRALCNMTSKLMSDIKYKYIGGEWEDFRKKCFRHWPVKKNGKKGYRLISAPRLAYRSLMRDYKDEILDKLEPVDDAGVSLISYKKGVDIVKAIHKEDLTIDSKGGRCLELDYSDFFTRITPELLTESLRKRSWSLSIDSTTKYAALFPELTGDHLDFEQVQKALAAFTVMYIGDLVPFSVKNLRDRVFSNSETYANVCVRLFSEIVTTALPLWKIDVAGKDLTSSVEKDDPYGYAKFAKNLRDPFTRVDAKGASALYEYHTKYGKRPWSVRGVPQGAPYSGNLANIVAGYLASKVVQKVESILNDFGGKVHKVIAYSDNLYIFYDANQSHQEVFKREIPKVINSVNGAKEGLLKSKKIFSVDRSRKDVKVLGLILDDKGHVRLSRKTRRYINRMIIQETRGIPMDESKFGKLKYYERIRVVAGDGDYNKSLIGIGRGPQSNERVSPNTA